MEFFCYNVVYIVKKIIAGGVEMKKIRVPLVVLCIALLFTGCSNFRLATSIEDLISPISPSGENAGVQSAVDEYCKGGYSIKIPSKGEYTTSFIFYDLDEDGQNEAIFFYEPSDSIGTIDMAVLKKSGDRWSVTENIEGSATDVNRVDFCDVNNDGSKEIIVCWSAISKTANSKINVYIQSENDGQYSLENIDGEINANEFICADVNGDGVTEILAFSLGSSSQSPNARLYSFENSSKKLLGETKLDSTIVSFNNIICGETQEGVSVYADAVKSSGDSMVTEFIYWSDYYDSIVSPFYSYSSGKTSETVRTSMVNSRDIDGDGIIEIPVDKTVENLPSQLGCQNWVEYKNTILNHKCYSVSCERDGFILMLEEDYLSGLSLRYNPEARMFSVMSEDGKTECFSIITVLKSNYSSSDIKYKDYSEIYSNSGFVYLAKINDSAETSVTVDNLKDMIKTY